jgi:hypothetical protein
VDFKLTLDKGTDEVSQGYLLPALEALDPAILLKVYGDHTRFFVKRYDVEFAAGQGISHDMFGHVGSPMIAAAKTPLPGVDR